MPPIVHPLGEHLAVVAEGAMLEPGALDRVAAALAADPAIDVLYVDEDRFCRSEGLVDPFLKPDWSPERMVAQDVAGALVAVRRSLVDELGGLRADLGGAATYDLVLRAAEHTDRIAHLAEVLVHLPVETVPDTDGEHRAVVEALHRRGVPAVVDDLPQPGLRRIRRSLPASLPTVSIVIPTAGTARPVWGRERPLVLGAVDSVLATTSGVPVELVVVVDPVTPPEVRAQLAARPVSLVDGTAPFSYAERCNQGVNASSGEVVLLLNDDVLVEQDGWLEDLLALLQDPEVGVVGARLLYADGRLQHAGVLCNAQPLHAFRGFPADEPGPRGLLLVDHEVSAVTGACLLTRRALWDELGGLDEAFAVAFNDLDYCLRVRRLGRRILWTPHVTLYHFESQSRPPDAAQPEIDLLYERWSPELHADPYGNPNLAPKQATWLPRLSMRLSRPLRSWRVLRTA